MGTYGLPFPFPYQRLGSARLLVAATTSNIVSWSGLYEQLLVNVAIPGYAGAGDVASLQAGITQGVIDTAANYWNRTLSAAAGGTALTDTPQAADTMIRLGLPTTLGRSAWVHITNFSNSKVFKVISAIGTGAAATVGTAQLNVEGEYIAAGQIQCLRLTVPGGNNMFSKSQLVVFGMNA